MGTKVCCTCKAEKPLTAEHFRKNKANKDGFTGQCLECLREYGRNYARANRDKANKYVNENREKIAEYRRNYHKENKERERLLNKAWQAANRDRVYQSTNKHRTKNRDKYKTYAHNRKARNRGLEHTLTTEQWMEIKKAFDNRCAYCGKKKSLTQDHFVPACKGGDYTHNNIVPACRNCNCKKHTQDFFIWYPEYEHYNMTREKKVLKFLNYIDEHTQQLGLFL